MPIKSILVRRSLANVCYLREALMWVAFNRFPLSFLVGEVSDIRDDDVDPEPKVDVRDPTYLECASIGLSERPIYRGRRLGPRLAEFTVEAVDEYRENRRRWDEEFSDFIDIHRARLFLALREGKLVAKGVSLTDNEKMDSKWTTITPEFWVSSRINWEKSRASGRVGEFLLIQVNTEELFACFPPPAAEIVKVMKVANDFVSMEQADDEPKARIRGRPPLDWMSFHVEMARRIWSENGLPEKQESLIADMQGWCRGAWGHPVARSTLQQKIKPYYDRLARHPKRST
jgi:hypothetical protein